MIQYVPLGVVKLNDANIVSNLLICAIYNIIYDPENPFRRSLVSIEDDIYYKSHLNKKTELKRLTTEFLYLLFPNLKKIIKNMKRSFSELESIESTINVDYIKNKLSEFVPDITPCLEY
jgi:hypothetical protein